MLHKEITAVCSANHTNKYIMLAERKTFEY